MNLFSYILKIYKTANEEMERLSNVEVWVSMSKIINPLLLAMIVLLILTITIEITKSGKEAIKVLIPLILLIVPIGIFCFIMYKFGPLYTPIQIKIKEKEQIEKNEKVIKEIQSKANIKIKELYDNNIELFDNYKTNNVSEILKKAEEKEKTFKEEVTKTMQDIKSKAFEKNIFFDDEQMKPFIELYVMNKNNIPLYGKVEQKISPEETGKICKALAIEKCWENSSFTEYNAEIKRKEEEKENKDNRYVEGFATATLLGFLTWYIIK